MSTAQELKCRVKVDPAKTPFLFDASILVFIGGIPGYIHQHPSVIDIHGGNNMVGTRLDVFSGPFTFCGLPQGIATERLCRDANGSKHGNCQIGVTNTNSKTRIQYHGRITDLPVVKVFII